MLHDSRPGNRPLLGHVPDDEDRHLVLLRKLHDAADALAQLGHRSRRRSQLRGRHGLDRIDDQHSRAIPPGLTEHVLEGCVGEHFETRAFDRETVCPLAHLAQRLLAGGIENRHVALHLAADLLQQGRFADAGIAAEQHDGAGHEPATKDPVELRKTGGVPVFQVRLRTIQRGCLDTAAGGGRDPHFRKRIPRAAIGALTGPLHAMGTAVGAYVGCFWLRHSAPAGAMRPDLLERLQ